MENNSYNMNLSKISSQVLRFYPLIGICLIIFSINRFVFFYIFSNYDYYDWFKIIRGFLLGIRYDSATIMYGLSIPIIFLYSTIFIKSKFYYKCILKISSIWMASIFVFFIYIFIVDIYFYDFFQVHLNIIFFDFFYDDTEAVFNSILKNYPIVWILAILAVSFIIIYYLLYLFFESKKHFRIINFKNNILILFFSFIVFLLLARSSFSMFPINMMDAAYTNDPFLNKLAPNPVFTFEKAIEAYFSKKNKRPFWQINKFKNDLDYASQLTEEHFIGINKSDSNKINQLNLNSLVRYTSKKNEYDFKKPNVVIVLMEGYGAWILDHETESFDISCGVSDWIEKSIYFENFFQSGYSSIQNLVATVLSVPSIPGRIPFTQRKFGIIPFQSSFAEIFRQNGYETTFIYGGKLSWQNIGNFMPQQGFDNVLGEGNIGTGVPRTDWGVYDEYLFEFAYKILNNAETPQFMVLFTTTNHPPYDLPDNFSPPLLEMSDSLKNIIMGHEDLAKKRFAAYQYSSCYLNNFMESIYENPKLKNTVSLVTADHNLQGIRNYYEEDFIHKYRIPFFIYGPSNFVSRPRISKTLGTHVDIGPTIMNMLFSDISYISFGKDLLEINNNLYVTNQIGLLASNNNILNYDYQIGRKRGLYKWHFQDNPLLNRFEDKEKEKLLLDRMTAYFSMASYYIELQWENYSKNLSTKSILE